MKTKSTFILIFGIFIWFINCTSPKSSSKIDHARVLQNDSLVVALFPYYPPYQFINNKNEIDGILIDYLELLEQKMGVKFERRLYSDWSKVLRHAKKDSIDMILEIQHTKARESFLDFYKPLFESNQVIVTRKEDVTGSKLEDFYGKEITMPDSYAILENINIDHPQIITKPNFDELTCIQKLSQGQYDGYIGPKAVVNYFLRSQEIDNLKIVANIDYQYKPGIATVKSKPELNRAVQQGISKIEEKEKQLIFDNWLYAVITPFYKQPKFWKILAITTSLLTILIISINQYLKYLVSQKTKELIIAKNNAEESNILKTAFINNISHEIRTPMNGILGFSRLLNEEKDNPQRQKEYAEIIIQSSNQLIHIIDDIIEISKLQTNQVSVQNEETDYNKIITIIFKEYKAKAEQKNLTFVLENRIHQDQSTILIDKVKLQKVLKNLVDNALKFTKKGGVLIFSKIQNKNIKVDIKDTGIGIHPKDQELIFKNFSQSKKEASKSYDGLGLGLSIANKNAKLLGGEITFSSVPAKGSNFTFTFPYKPIISANKNKKRNSQKNIKTPIKQLILIAEDGDINFLFLKTLLLKMSDYKFAVQRAENGQEAYEECKENPDIDLVLMDIRMPIMDGHLATKKIKEIRPNLPIIAQTAYSTAEDIRNALEAGCDDFVSKPVDHNILKPIIKKYFRFPKGYVN